MLVASIDGGPRRPDEHTHTSRRPNALRASSIRASVSSSRATSNGYWMILLLGSSVPTVSSSFSNQSVVLDLAQAAQRQHRLFSFLVRCSPASYRRWTQHRGLSPVSVGIAAPFSRSTSPEQRTCQFADDGLTNGLGGPGHDTDKAILIASQG